MKLDQRPPTNGRKLTTEDIVLSWQKCEKDSAFKGNLSHAANEFAPISSLRALDDQTIEIKTAVPDAQLLASLGFKFNLWVVPKEAFKGSFDPATTMRGYWSAPYRAGFGPYWLDPNDTKFGPSAKYLKHNVAEVNRIAQHIAQGPPVATRFT